MTALALGGTSQSQQQVNAEDLGAADDEWAHALWNFMAIYHVAVHTDELGDKNDLFDLESLRAQNELV